MFHIYIGPNGFGKTRALELERDSLIKSGVKEDKILFIESELLLLDEIKDSKDTSKTMEFIIDELLLSSHDFKNKRDDFENCVDSIISSNISNMNDMLDEVLRYNNSTRDTTKDFIQRSKAKEYKKLVSINSKDIKEKMGSGQRMQLILSLVRKYSSKSYIFLDEPEKYSHPTLLHKTAEILNELNIKGINIYIASHSPKLLSMLDLDLESLNIINDSAHVIKNIDFNKAIKQASFKGIESCKDKEKSYYVKSTLIDNIKNIHYKDFLECLFTKKVYVVEGINDKFFLLKVLKDNNCFFDEYFIFQAWGKFIIPVFCSIFKQLGIDIVVYFDQDDETKLTHSSVNALLSTFRHYKFSPKIENELGISDKYDIPKILSEIESFGSLKGKYTV